MEITGLHFKEKTTWNNVWQKWYEREGLRREWQEVAKEKGWKSWKDWRDIWVKNFNAQEREWFRYIIPNPLETIPNFRVGPTQTWQKNFPKNEYNKHSFAKLIEKNNYLENEKVLGILNNFPAATEFIGIIMPDNSIIVIEGHHRATALAIAKKNNKKINFKKLPTITLTLFEKEEEKLLNIMLAKGSAKK